MRKLDYKIENFKYTDRQKEALAFLTNDALHNCLVGGARSGKTFLFVRALIIRSLKVKSRHVILRDKFAHVKRSVWHETIPKVLTTFPYLHLRPNRSDFYYPFPNGSEIWVGGLDDKERTDKILGTEYSTIYFNECSQITYSARNTAMSRLAEKNSLKKKLYYDLNPAAKTHWSYLLFQKHLDPVENEPLENPEDFTSLTMNPSDNLDNLDENFLKLLATLPEKERQRFLEGVYQDQDEGVAYYAFNRETHVNNVPAYNGSMFIAMDFNVGRMSSIVGYTCSDRFYIIDSILLKGASDTYLMCDELKRRGYGGFPVIPDSTGRARKTCGKSDFQILREAGFRILPTSNPYVVDRVANTNRLFTNDRVTIDPKAKALVGDLEVVEWKNNQLDQSGGKDDPDKLKTHLSDCLGYFLWYFSPLIIQPESRQRSF